MNADQLDMLAPRYHDATIIEVHPDRIKQQVFPVVKVLGWVVHREKNGPALVEFHHSGEAFTRTIRLQDFMGVDELIDGMDPRQAVMLGALHAAHGITKELAAKGYWSEDELREQAEA